jgi:hypothetical protein
MRFRITGDFNTFRTSITWEDGRLEGPEEIVQAVVDEATRREGEALIAPDADDQPYSTTRHLRDPHSARELIRGQLDPNSDFELEVLDGDFPPRPGYRSRIVRGAGA